jgi:hypothetical protein
MSDLLAEDDDIDWKTDLFKMRPDRVNREMPDDIWLQEELSIIEYPVHSYQQDEDAHIKGTEVA